MPLHDWRKGMPWDGMHHAWITEIVRDLKRKLPTPYRAEMGTTPLLVANLDGRPDAHVERLPTPESLQLEDSAAGVATAAAFEPDLEVAVADLDVDRSVLVTHSGRVVAAIELISPRNKDRPDERDVTAARYASYLHDGVNLLIVDVHPQPDRQTVADRFSDRYGLNRSPLPAPYAAAYRVGEETNPGRRLALWSFPLTAGEPLPTVPVPLTVHSSVPLDLNASYAAAAELCYLD